MPICAACGHDAIEADSRFCPECGAKLLPPSKAPAPDLEASDARRPDSADVPAATAGSSVDVRMDVGEMSGGSKAVGLEVGEVTGGMTVNQGPERVEGDLVQGDKVVTGDYVGGDQISAQIGNVGAGSQIAVGKQIQQTGVGPAALSGAERASLEAMLAELDGSIEGMDLPLDRKLVGREFLSQLGKALLREDGPPEAGTIQVLGDWLIENLPGLRPGLARLFGSPAGRQVLALAGDQALAWSAKL